MNWRELKDKGVTLGGGAASGGLDSCTATHWLRGKGFDVHCFTVDLGQPDEEDLDDASQSSSKFNYSVLRFLYPTKIQLFFSKIFFIFCSSLT